MSPLFGGDRIGTEKEPTVGLSRLDRDIMLGKLVAQVEQLQIDITDIKDRLKEGDKDLVVLRFSRCLLGELDRYGIIKCILLAGIFLFTGYKLGN